MIARRGEASRPLVAVALAFIVGCIALYGLWVAERYVLVVTSLVLLIFASAAFNVSLNRALTGQLKSSDRSDSECLKCMVDEVEVESERRLVLSYHDPSRDSKAVYAISLPVSPGDRLGVVVKDGRQGIVINRS